MKSLYTELMEAGWKDKEIRKIPSKLAWEMAGSDKVKEKVKELKEMGFVIKGRNLLTTLGYFRNNISSVIFNSGSISFLWKLYGIC